MAASTTLFSAVGCLTIGFPYTSPSPSPSQPIPVSALSYAYVESSSAGTLSQFEVSPSGMWTPLSPPRIAIPKISESLVVDPTGRFVYVANAQENTVSQYVIAPGAGTLRQNQPSTVPTGAFPQWLAVDPLGHFLYVANTVGGTISMYTIDETTGALHPTSPAVIPFVTSSSGSSPQGLVVDPFSRFVFADGDGVVDTYSIDSSTGLLSPGSLQVSRFGGAFPPAVDPTGTFLYIPDLTQSFLQVSAIDPLTGALTPASVPSVLVGDGASSVAIDPTGKFLYVVNRQSQTISQFHVGAGGSLTPMLVPQVVDAGQPWQILIDPSGELAYVSNEETASITIYRIQADGALIQYASASAGLGAGGIGIARRH